MPTLRGGRVHIPPFPLPHTMRALLRHSSVAETQYKQLETIRAERHCYSINGLLEFTLSGGGGGACGVFWLHVCVGGCLCVWGGAGCACV